MFQHQSLLLSEGEVEGPWRAWTYAVIDLEGTGAQDREEEIIEVAGILISDGCLSDTVFHSLVNPNRPIPQLPWMMHGISDGDVREAPPMSAIRCSLERFLDQKVLVAHNARVDWRLLRRKCPRLQPRAILDTLHLSRKLYPEERRHRLSDLIDRFDLDDSLPKSSELRPHRALYDALATAHAFLHILTEKLPDHLELRELVRLCGIPLGAWSK